MEQVAPQLAARMATSERSFYRRFTGAVGETPAPMVETLRLGRVRDLLTTPASLKQIAAQTRFGTAQRLSKAFERRFGLSPLLFRETHCRPGARERAQGS